MLLFLFLAGVAAAPRYARQLAHRVRPDRELALLRGTPLHGLFRRGQPDVMALPGQLR